MQRVEIPFGEWLPSGPDWKNPGLLEAENVVPSPGGYRPLLSHVGVQDVAAPVRGGAAFYRQDGTPIVVAGTATTLQTYVGGTLTGTTSLTTLTDDQAWQFAQFNNFVIATSVTNAPRYLDNINTATSWTTLPGSPPTGRYVARVSEFLFIGGIANAPNRIQWSAFNSPATSWSPDRLTQADFQDLPQQFGPVQGIVGGRYSIVFQERGVVRLDQVEPPVVFRVTEIERDRGCTAPYSIVTSGFVTAFLAQDGFWTTNGSAFQPIGSSRVNRWFFETVDQSRITEVQGAVDWQSESFVWAFPTINALPGQRDMLLFFSWSQNRWTMARVATNWLVVTRVPGFTLEQLSTAHPNLENVPFSLDSPAWRPRQQALGAFVPSGSGSSWGLFNGPTMQATFETGEFQPLPGRRVFMTEGWPLVDGTQSNIEMGVVSSDAVGASFTGPLTPKGVAGFCPIRAGGKSLRARVRIPAGALWRDMTGFQAAFTVGGLR